MARGARSLPPHSSHLSIKSEDQHVLDQLDQQLLLDAHRAEQVVLESVAQLQELGELAAIEDVHLALEPVGPLPGAGHAQLLLQASELGQLFGQTVLQRQEDVVL
jgi:hypothetical protein